MINRQDVIRVKMPYPTINSGLAVEAHMYICKENNNHNCSFVKCQTLKPYMLTNNLMQHFCDEQPDISRNPFKQTTRIDCDKAFVTSTVIYDNRLKTPRRPDVCEDLFTNVLRELNKDGYTSVVVNEAELCNLNPLVVFI